MPTNTQGQPISTASGSIVPNATQGPTLGMGVPPTLNAQFMPPPKGTTKPPAVVTSQQAEDHVKDMGSATTTALTDAQNLAAHKAALMSAVYGKDSQIGSQDQNPDATATGKTNDASSSGINDLLSSMGLGNEPTDSSSSGASDQQQGVLDQDAAAIAADQQAQQQVSDSMDALSSGSFPLSPAEQAQVEAVKSSYAGSLTAAQSYAKNVQNGAMALVAKNSQQMYSPQIALGTIRNAITTGQAKVDQVNNQIVSSMSKLTTALQNADYKTASNLYTKIGEDIKTRQSEIDSINKTVTDTQKQLLDASQKASDAFSKAQEDVLKSINANGAPDTVRQAVANATDLSSMYAAARQYLSAGSGTGITGAYSLYVAQAKAMGKTPMDILDFSQVYNKAPKAAKSTTDASLGFTSSSSDSTTNSASDTPSTTKLDQAGITNWLSDFYGAGGKVNLPALGIGNVAASVKVGILNGIAERNHELGISGSQFSAIISSKQSAQKALDTISRNQGMMTVAEGTATKNFDLVLSMLDKLPPKTISPWLNQFVQTGNIQIGGADVKPLQDAILTSLNEYAKVITGQTSGAAVSDAARREAQSLLSAADTTDTIKNVINTAKTEMGNRVSSYTEAKQKETDLISSVHGDGVTVPDEDNSSPVDEALGQSMSNDQAAQKLLNLAADGTYGPKIDALRKENPTMTPVQIYQIFFPQ